MHEELINDKWNKHYNLIWGVLIAIFLCMWGGIYDFSAIFYGCILSICIFVLFVRKKSLLISKDMTSMALILMLLGFILSCFGANDTGIAIIGVYRTIVLIVFWILWMNISSDNRSKIWQLLPDVVSLLTLAAIAAYFWPVTREYFYKAGRLGGVFQYSNTYALLLLIAMIVLIVESKRSWRYYIEVVILLTGFLLCGSRTSMVLLVLLLVYLAYKRKLDRKSICCMLMVAVAIVCVAFFVQSLDIQRLLKLSLKSSTLNGRFLYWFDALPVFISHPLGLGYMGYYFLQPQFQTGNYTTKYVHNDFLQFGLDGGWIAMAAIIILIISGIRNNNNSGIKKIIILLIAVHSLFEFDLQYTFMFLLLLMCMGAESKNIKRITGHRILLGIWGGILISGYLSFALSLSYFGANLLAVKAYPWNSFARESRVIEDGDVESASYLVRKNGMLPVAYECLTSDALANGKYKTAEEYIDYMLQWAGYDSYYYNQAVYYWSISLDQAYRAGDEAAVIRIVRSIQGVSDQIRMKTESASKLAFRINDKPEIDLEEAILEYINKISTISDIE